MLLEFVAGRIRHTGRCACLRWLAVLSTQAPQSLRRAIKRIQAAGSKIVLQAQISPPLKLNQTLPRLTLTSRSLQPAAEPRTLTRARQRPNPDPSKNLTS